MKRFFAISFLLISVGLAQREPEWIFEMPSDEEENFYWARVNVFISDLDEEEYKSKANIEALQNISMQIRTTVAGQSKSNVSEIMSSEGDSFKDEFEQEASTSTIADIEGAVLVGDYKTPVSYWVLWKLNKKVHAENMEKYVEAVQSQYEAFTYIEQDSPNDLVQKLQYLIPAYESLVKVAGFPVEYEGKNLKTIIPNKISKITNALRLVSDGPSEFTGQAGFALGKPLKVKINAGKKVNKSGIPISFIVESGELQFSESLKQTSEDGRAQTKVSNILSRKPTQKVRAMIDLKEWREDRMSEMVSFEKRLDEISRVNSVLFSLDIKRVTQEKIAIIAVTQDTAMFSEEDMKRINTELRTRFAEETDFKLKDENTIDEIIKEYKRSAKLCSNEECQIQIGKKLGVERLLFVDVDDSPKEVSVTYFLRNIAENEFELQYGYDFTHKQWKEKPPAKPKGYDRAIAKLQRAENKLNNIPEENETEYNAAYETYELLYEKNENNEEFGRYESKLDEYNSRFIPFKNTIVSDIIDNVQDMVKDFWVRTNPGRLTLKCNTRGVKADITYLGSNKYMEKKFVKRLPILDEKFLEGSYNLKINKLGYEKYKLRFDVAMGEFPIYDVNLKAKRPSKALLRSLFVPGRGQIYSSDTDHKSRMAMGFTYFISTMAGVASSGFLWNNYLKSKDIYEGSKSAYQDAVNVNDVQVEKT